MLATPTCVPWKLPGRPRAVSVISSRWLIACSMPELGAVEPATPIAMPLRVRMRASSPRAAVLAQGDDPMGSHGSASAALLTGGDDPTRPPGSASAPVLTGGDDPPEPPRSGSAAV